MDPATILTQAAAVARLFDLLINIAEEANGGPLSPEQLAVVHGDKKAVDNRLEALEAQAQANIDRQSNDD